MTIDFVLHPGGVASPWAVRARPGDVVYLTEAGGWYAPTADAQWQVLMTDLTGLPALGRILENPTSAIATHAIAEVIEPADEQHLRLPVQTSISWLHGTGNGIGASRLLEALRALTLPSGPGYLWFAGDAAESRAVRKFLRHEWGWANERFTILGYWRVKQEQWMARYATIGERLEGIYASALAQGRSEGDALEIYDDALEKAGL